MNIIKTNYAENEKRARYAITHGKALKVNDIEADTKITLTDYAIYEDIDAKGISKLIAAFIFEGQKYASTSPTFIKSLDEILEFLADEDEPIEIIIKKAISKSGRQFLDCEVAL